MFHAGNAQQALSNLIFVQLSFQLGFQIFNLLNKIVIMLCNFSNNWLRYKRQTIILKNGTQSANNGSSSWNANAKFQQKSMHLIGCFTLS